MSWPCSGGEIVTERNNKKENVRDREDRSREREKNKLEIEMLVARLIFRLSVLFQTHQTYHEQIWKTICLHKPSASNLSKNFCYVEYLHAAAFFVKYSMYHFSVNVYKFNLCTNMAPDNARSMTASWSQQQESSGPWTAFTWEGQGTYLMHYNLDERPNPPPWAKVSEKRGFQLLEDCGTIFLETNYPEKCHLNRMRPLRILTKQGFGVVVILVA